MKRIFLAGFILAAIPAFAQNINASKVPDAVKKSFHKTFPSIQEAKWEKERGNYEANFRMNRQKQSATFDAKGDLLETERGIAVTALPADVTSYIEKNCKGKSIHEAAIITKSNGETIYEASVEGMDYLFDSKGNFIRTQKD